MNPQSASSLSGEWLLSVENVGKTYGGSTARGMLNAMVRKRRDHRCVVALKNVSLQLNRGCIHGIIGPDGAGKSTLLRIMGGVMLPTSGRVVGRGKVSGLYGFGALADGAKTGRENVRIQARLMGWSQKEVNERIDEIASFAELDRFMDVKVARYSKGMQMRLDFSIAVNLNPDILLLDEVLAVGDRSFQERAIARLEELAAGGTGVIFVSSDMNHVTRLCHSVSLMHSGSVQCQGAPGLVIPRHADRPLTNTGSPLAHDEFGQIISVQILKPDGSPASLVTDDVEPLVEIKYLALARTDKVRVGLSLCTNGQPVLLSEQLLEVAGRDGPMYFRARIPREYLSNRTYSVNASVLPIRSKHKSKEPSVLKVTAAATFEVLQARSAVAGAIRPEVNPLFRLKFHWILQDLPFASAPAK